MKWTAKKWVEALAAKHRTAATEARAKQHARFMGETTALRAPQVGQASGNKLLDFLTAKK